MSWYLLAFLSAAADASYYALVKKYVRNLDQYVLASGAFLLTAFFTLPCLFVLGWPRLQPDFWTALIGTASLNFLASSLIYRSLQTTDLSLIVPTKALTPIFLVATSFIMLRELPTLAGCAGIGLVVVGSYVLHSTKRKESFLQFGRRVWKQRGVRYMLLVVIIFSITANFDKLVVQNSSPVFALFATSATLGIVFFMVALWRKRLGVARLYAQYLPAFSLVALISVAGGLAINTALSLQIVPYVISLKRFSTVFGVLFGWWFFNEKNIRRRLIGAAIMLAGSVSLIVWG